MREQNKNIVILSGLIENVPEFLYELYEECFYKFVVCVKRQSGAIDRINSICAQKVLPKNALKVGDNIKIEGQFRSRNIKEPDKRKLDLTVFCKKINNIYEEEKHVFENSIELEGYVCKTPSYRKTPLGREITDIILAVNRTQGKTDYLPCILWGNNAKRATQYQTGDKLSVLGRIQSRDYIKTKHEQQQLFTAYEISCAKVHKIEQL